MNIETGWWEGFMKYATQMGSGDVVCIPSIVKIVSGIQKLIGGNV
jgi:hypothetical protein